VSFDVMAPTGVKVERVELPADRSAGHASD